MFLIYMYFTLEDGTSNKRYRAIFYNRKMERVKTTQFGDKRYENYTIQKVRDILTIKLTNQ